MRIDDIPVPTVTLDPITAGGPIASWPFRPVIAAQNNAGVWVDLTCSFAGLRISIGPADKRGNVPASSAAFTLENSSGEWARYTAAGVLLDWSPGNAVAIWTTDGVTIRRHFTGRIAAWDDLGIGLVEVECYDAGNELAETIGRYTPGVAGQYPGERLAALMALTTITNTWIFDTGITRLTAQATTRSPLDEARVIVQSDGGTFFVDVDGRIRSLDRRWRGGRNDQVVVPEFSTADCGADFIVWDAALTTNDDGKADKVVLTNVAGTQASYARTTPPALRFTTTGQTVQQWTDPTLEGAALARFIQETAPVAGELTVKEFTIHALDPLQPALWSTALELRIFDRINYVHLQPAHLALPTSITLLALVTGLRHDVTPDGGWTTTVSTARALDLLRARLWDNLPTPYEWDALPTPELWSY